MVLQDAVMSDVVTPHTIRWMRSDYILSFATLAVRVSLTQATICTLCLSSVVYHRAAQCTNQDKKNGP